MLQIFRGCTSRLRSPNLAHSRCRARPLKRGQVDIIAPELQPAVRLRVGGRTAQGRRAGATRSVGWRRTRAGFRNGAGKPGESVAGSRRRGERPPVLSYVEWRCVFVDAKLSTAIPDRLTHRCGFIATISTRRSARVVGAADARSLGSTAPRFPGWSGSAPIGGRRLASSGGRLAAEANDAILTPRRLDAV
jgi:hypothetical protein